MFAGPIIRTQVVIAESQKVEGIGRDRLVGVQFQDLFEAMCGGQIGPPPIIEFPHEEMGLGQEVVAFLDLLKSRAVIPASLKIFPQPFKGFERFLNGARIPLNSFGQLHLALSYSELRIGGEHVSPMEFEEMVVLDDGFRILLFLEERLSSLHDDVGVVVLFHRIAHENLLVSAAQGFLRGLLLFGCAGTGRDEAEHRDTEANGRCQLLGSREDGGNPCHYCREM